MQIHRLLIRWIIRKSFVRIRVPQCAGIPDVSREKCGPKTVSKRVPRRIAAASWKPQFAFEQCALRGSLDYRRLLGKQGEMIFSLAVSFWNSSAYVVVI
nr:hypothetical protein [Massilia timonae]